MLLWNATEVGPDLEYAIVKETKEEWLQRLEASRLLNERLWRERWSMSSEDRAPHNSMHIQRIPRQAVTDRSVGNHVSDIGTAFYTKHDANAELQKSQPNWYGPFLEEGECATTRRDARRTSPSAART